MAEQMTGAIKLIDDRGGCRVVAAALDWPYTTVHTFYRTNKAPKYRWNAIRSLPLVEKAARRKRRRTTEPTRRAA